MVFGQVHNRTTTCTVAFLDVRAVHRVPVGLTAWTRVPEPVLGLLAWVAAIATTVGKITTIITTFRYYDDHLQFSIRQSCLSYEFVSSIMICMRTCSRCKNSLPLNNEYFYPFRARRKGKPDDWQMYCKSCTREVNATAKLRLKLRYLGQ